MLGGSSFIHYWRILAVVLAAGCVLAFAINLSLPPEQDQGSKAGKILCMIGTGSYFSPTAKPVYYCDDLLPLYYVIASLFCRVAPMNIYGAMNMLSALFGVACFTALAYTASRVYNAAYWETSLVFFSMPLLISTFTYGTESALSFSFLVFSLTAAVSNRQWKLVFSAAFFAIAVYCRPDILLMIPFWLGWIGVYGGVNDSKLAPVIRMVRTGIACAIFGGILWLALLRVIPHAEVTFPFNTNPRIFLAYLVYPFCPSIVLISIVSAIYFLRKRNWNVLLLFLCLIPIWVFRNNFCTPKYIIPVSLFYGLLAVHLIHQLKSYWKSVAVASICFWWVFSASPYGLMGPMQGRFWTLPTSHGQLPLGSYVAFWNLYRQGYYQENYRDEIASLEAAAEYQHEHPKEGYCLYGRSNYHFFLCIKSLRGSYGESKEYTYLTEKSLPPDTGRILMVPYGILRADASVTEKYRQWIIQMLEEGRVRNCTSHEAAFPLLVEIGHSLPVGTDKDLGKRMLFMMKYFGGFGAVRTKMTADCYRTLWWLDKNAKEDYQNLIYKDSQYRCYSSPVPGAEIWRSRVPFCFFNIPNPNIVTNYRE